METLIPIQNLYYLLCYAWGLPEQRHWVNVDAKSCPAVVDLLSRLLTKGADVLLKRGRSFPALVPEKSVIDSFEKELSPILNEQEILEEEINHAEQIRDSLLPRLMSGELVMNC